MKNEREILKKILFLCLDDVSVAAATTGRSTPNGTLILHLHVCVWRAKSKKDDDSIIMMKANVYIKIYKGHKKDLLKREKYSFISLGINIYICTTENIFT